MINNLPNDPVRRRSRRRPRQARGFILFGVLICLVIAGAMVLGWFRDLASQRRQQRLVEQKAQTKWLAEAGIERAAAKLRSDRRYTGETWHVPAADLNGHDDAQITLHVGAAVGQPNRRTLEATADFPSDELRRTRITKKIDLSFAKDKESEH